MKFAGLVLIVLIVAAVIVEASITANPWVRPRRGIFDECLTCRAEDKPFYYPLIKYFNKMKDAVVKGVSEITATAKDYIKKLE